MDSSSHYHLSSYTALCLRTSIPEPPERLWRESELIWRFFAFRQRGRDQGRDQGLQEEAREWRQVGWPYRCQYERRDGRDGGDRAPRFGRAVNALPSSPASPTPASTATLDTLAQSIRGVRTVAQPE